MKFEVGEVVRLKSGGTSMSVESVDADGEKVGCVWREKVKGKTVSSRDTYLAATLEKAGPGVVGVSSPTRRL